MLDLKPGSEDLSNMRAALEPLEGMAPLRKFVYVFANVSPDGGRLTKDSNILEGLLFVVWQEACAELDVRVSDPTIAAIHPDDEEA